MLLVEGRIGPLEGFRSKEGRPFAAAVKLGLEGKPEFDFPAQKIESIDLSTAVALCDCAVCNKGKVYATESSYTCNLAVEVEKECNYRMGKTIHAAGNPFRASS